MDSQAFHACTSCGMFMCLAEDEARMIFDIKKNTWYRCSKMMCHLARIAWSQGFAWPEQGRSLTDFNIQQLPSLDVSHTALLQYPLGSTMRTKVLTIARYELDAGSMLLRTRNEKERT